MFLACCWLINLSHAIFPTELNNLTVPKIAVSKWWILNHYVSQPFSEVPCLLRGVYIFCELLAVLTYFVTPGWKEGF